MNEEEEQILNDFANGNMSPSRRKWISARYTQRSLRQLFMAVGYSFVKATLIAEWIEGEDCYQEMCDATYED